MADFANQVFNEQLNLAQSMLINHQKQQNNTALISKRLLTAAEYGYSLSLGRKGSWESVDELPDCPTNHQIELFETTTVVLAQFEESTQQRAKMIFKHFVTVIIKTVRYLLVLVSGLVIS